ncbi:cupin domain-containing protein [Kitasatospora sp. GP82]|uniref:cupin domain-containing protein n=1 Tax=Kitasatospora sp. GP82 TaxID=3035089 RepID=UPI002474A1DB|nr:cupin domain-containing protein [Kitasatospora sp. GP82]MDH6125655.1 mannose-6-phosphate isomerase-like protein (cupin superfamily) [Kitasatospora sp. GP82]
MEHPAFETSTVERALAVRAPDGATVRPLAVLAGQGSLAQFELPPGGISQAVSHATVQEMWHITQGTGRIWRRQGSREEVVPLRPGSVLTIPLGTAFQFRADQDSPPLQITAVTMPPWPGNDTEARPERGPWTANPVDRPTR